jgi:hypothetical protein
MRNPLDPGKEFERLLKVVVMMDILSFTQRRSLIVMHSGDSILINILPTPKRNSMVIHFYRKNNT